MEEARRRLDERKRRADISSLRRAELSSIHASTTHTPHRQGSRHASRLAGVPDAERSHMTRNLESSFMSLDANGNVIPITPAAAIPAVATYLQVTQPPEGDPRAEQHRQAILGMGMIGAKLGMKEALQPEAAPRREPSPRHNTQEQEAELPHGNHEAPRREEASPRRRDTERQRYDDRERKRPDDRNAT